MNMNDKQLTSEEKISKLRSEYVHNLSQRFTDMNQAYIDILGAKAPAAIIETLKVLSHTFCGSAGTFGFSDIASYCKRIEGLCEHLIKDVHNVEILDEISESLSQLEEAILNPRVSDQAVLVEFTATNNIERTPKLIYLLDDDEGYSVNLKNKIENYGYQVRIFHVLDDFFDALEKELPEVMIIDIVLDNDCGADALRFLYEHKSIYVPSIMISAQHDFETRLKTVRARADAFLIKPFDTADIIDYIETLTGEYNSEPYRVLIVDDIELMSAYYRVVLERAGITCVTLSDPTMVMQTLSDFDPEMVLMDLHMPVCRGDELAKLIHQDKTYISLPIVYLSSETSAKEQLNALQMGGDDFLTKPIRPSQLIGAVKTRAKRFRQIKSMMNTDSLTGLLNHSSLKLTLDRECSRSSRTQQEFCFAMVDLDHFKRINDKHGHIVGDMVLKNLSWLFKQRLRKTDIVGRYGGEEFGIIMPETSLENGAHILNELLHAFRSLEIKYDSELLDVTFSAGVVVFPEYQNAQDICQAADKLLYEAKAANRNQIVTRSVNTAKISSVT